MPTSDGRREGHTCASSNPSGQTPSSSTRERITASQSNQGTGRALRSRQPQPSKIPAEGFLSWTLPQGSEPDRGGKSTSPKKGSQPPTSALKADPCLPYRRREAKPFEIAHQSDLDQKEATTIISQPMVAIEERGRSHQVRLKRTTGMNLKILQNQVRQLRTTTSLR